MTEINASDIKETVLGRYPGPTEELEASLHYRGRQQAELNQRARVAAFFGTLQAGFTDFHYLRDIWRSTTEQDALIGVGITGICSGDILDLNLEEAQACVLEENARVASLIGINDAARNGCVKPSGTTSCVVGSSSGIHAWHAKYYIRNMQCKVGDDIYNYFVQYHPGLVKVMDLDPHSAVIGIPQMAPEGAILREDETAVQMLDRVFKFYTEWVATGHRSGANTNNVSATVSVDAARTYCVDNEEVLRPILNGEEGVYYELSEWEAVGQMLWLNRDKFNGMSVLPYDGGSYLDAPFITCSKEVYEEKFALCKGIDFTQIIEEDDSTSLTESVACSGGACEV